MVLIDVFNVKLKGVENLPKWILQDNEDIRTQLEYKNERIVSKSSETPVYCFGEGTTKGASLFAEAEDIRSEADKIRKTSTGIIVSAKKAFEEAFSEDSFLRTEEWKSKWTNPFFPSATVSSKEIIDTIRIIMKRREEKKKAEIFLPGVLSTAIQEIKENKNHLIFKQEIIKNEIKKLYTHLVDNHFIKKPKLIPSKIFLKITNATEVLRNFVLEIDIKKKERLLESFRDVLTDNGKNLVSTRDELEVVLAKFVTKFSSELGRKYRKVFERTYEQDSDTYSSEGKNHYETLLPLEEKLEELITTYNFINTQIDESEQASSFLEKNPTWMKNDLIIENLNFIKLCLSDRYSEVAEKLFLLTGINVKEIPEEKAKIFFKRIKEHIQAAVINNNLVTFFPTVKEGEKNAMFDLKKDLFSLELCSVEIPIEKDNFALKEPQKESQSPYSLKSLEAKEHIKEENVEAIQGRTVVKSCPPTPPKRTSSLTQEENKEVFSYSLFEEGLLLATEKNVSFAEEISDINEENVSLLADFTEKKMEEGIKAPWSFFSPSDTSTSSIKEALGIEKKKPVPLPRTSKINKSPEKETDTKEEEAGTLVFDIPTVETKTKEKPPVPPKPLKLQEDIIPKFKSPALTTKGTIPPVKPPRTFEFDRGLKLWSSFEERKKSRNSLQEKDKEETFLEEPVFSKTEKSYDSFKKKVKGKKTSQFSSEIGKFLQNLHSKKTKNFPINDDYTLEEKVNSSSFISRLASSQATLEGNTSKENIEKIEKETTYENSLKKLKEKNIRAILSRKNDKYTPKINLFSVSMKEVFS